MINTMSFKSFGGGGGGGGGGGIITENCFWTELF